MRSNSGLQGARHEVVSPPPMSNKARLNGARIKPSVNILAGVKSNRKDTSKENKKHLKFESLLGGGQVGGIVNPVTS